MSDWFFVVCQIAVIASALVGGVFLTFSDFVMKSLAAAAPAGGIESMQIINRKVFKTVFMVLLLGMSALSPFFIWYALARLDGAVEGWVLAGGVMYFAGVFLVSMVFNVPMNERLDALDHTGSEADAYWREYVPRWSFWNYVRAIAGTGSAVCFLVASNIAHMVA
jgi:uncharacterized membrane protein